MKSYTHFSQSERYQIAGCLAAKMSQKSIGELLARSPASVCRELKRRDEKGNYCPVAAQQSATRPPRKAGVISHSVWESVGKWLRLDLSPDQVANKLKAENAGIAVVSHERIYQYIYANPEFAFSVHTRRHRSRRKPWRRGVKACVIKHRRDISERPAVVEERSRVGDWEADTIIGAGQAGAILTLTERATGVILIRPLANKTAEAVRVAMIYLLTPLKEYVKTITSDNGTEFARHQEVAKALDADFFFAKPHSPWQRGSNENGNGLLRQYFPKGMKLNAVPDMDTHFATQRLNNRPRKRFGYATPLQRFEQMTGLTQVHVLMRIALQS